MKDENRLYWIWLSQRCGVASKDFGRLMERFDDPFEIYRLEEEEIEQLLGISPTQKIRLFDKSLEDAYSILRYCKQKGIDIVAYTDKRYPSRLRSIEDPPVLLYLKGKMPDMDNRLCVGMVGTRKISEYGKDSSYKISYELAAANTVVVSGMALGVDGVSACGALAAGGQTVAVLGSGISVVYPREHQKLMDAIAKRGAVVSEYPPFEKPLPHNFPKRNRIISGMCQGVLVIEGSAGSGALITANKAISQGRELFALPGKINESNSDGPNELIKNGALVALSADDILVHYDFLYHDCINYANLRKAKKGIPDVDAALKKYGAAAECIVKRERNSNTQKPTTQKTEQTEQTAKAEVKQNTDRSAETAHTAQIEGLDENSKKVYLAMPTDRAVSPDLLSVDGLGVGDVITALTMLEISGLVSSVAGGMYIRK